MAGTKILEVESWRNWARSRQATRGGESPPVRKFLTATVKGGAVDPATGMRRFAFIASTGSVDREGDVIDPGGWELGSFKANPVILWAHEYSKPPIGRAVEVGLTARRDALRVEVEFTPREVNPDGYRVHQLVEAGFLKAVSVGFRPLSYTFNAERQGYDFHEAELLEVSVVPVPANAEALMAAGLGGTTAKWYERELAKGAADVGEVDLADDEVMRLIGNAIADRIEAGDDDLVEIDMTEGELRKAIHRALADEITARTGRLVDDPRPDTVEGAAQVVREAFQSAFRDAAEGDRVRSEIERILMELER